MITTVQTSVAHDELKLIRVKTVELFVSSVRLDLASIYIGFNCQSWVLVLMTLQWVTNWTFKDSSQQLENLLCSVTIRKTLKEIRASSILSHTLVESKENASGGMYHCYIIISHFASWRLTSLDGRRCDKATPLDKSVYFISTYKAIRYLSHTLTICV